MRPAVIELGTRAIGDGQPCFVLADVGAAHGGQVDVALKMLEAAFKMGADGIKFQVFRAERLVVRRHPSRKDFERVELSERDWRAVLRAARGSGLSVVVEPLDVPSLELAH
jgi:N,N'-diacetyllegionaminate synthase